MFSGFMSLWIILFSCRYWMPEPGYDRERQRVLCIILSYSCLINDYIALSKIELKKKTYAVKQPKDFIFLQATAVLWFVQKLNRQRSYRSIIGQENQLALVFNSFGTLRRSLPEQYSMVSRGESFKENDFNSSGTSLAWTTFIWFSLWLKEPGKQTRGLTRMCSKDIYDWFFCGQLTDFFMIWISLIQRLLLAEFNSKRQSFTAIFSSDSCKNTEDNGTNIDKGDCFHMVGSTYKVLEEEDIPKSAHPQFLLHFPRAAEMALVQCSLLHRLRSVVTQLLLIRNLMHC